MNTRRIAEQIAKAIDEAADEPIASIDGSNLSNSQYIEAMTDDGGRVKIRVATHDAKPTYERMNPSDFHVGATVRRDGRVEQWIIDHDGDWLDAVRFACRRLELTEPARISRMIDRRNAAIAARKQLLADQRAEREAAKRAEADRRERAIAELDDDDRAAMAEYDGSTGKHRKKLRKTGRVRQARQRLADRMEAMAS